MRTGKAVMWTLTALLITGGVLVFFFMIYSNGMGGSEMIFGRGELFSVNDIREFDLGSISRIEIAVSGSDTSLTATDSQKVRASLTGSIRASDPSFIPYIDARVDGSVLRIEVITKPFMFLDIFSSEVKLQVEIPGAFSGDLVFNGTSGRLTASSLKLNSCSLNTSSGDITLGSMDVSNGFTAGATSGRIKLERLQAGDAMFNTSSGDLILGDLEIRNDFSAGASSGKINIDRLSAANASLKDSSGDKRIAAMSVSGEAVLEGTSGLTSLDRVSAEKLVIHSTSGDARVGSAQTGHTAVRTSSGSISVRGFEGNADLSSSSGSITLICDRPASNIVMECNSGSINLGLPASAQFSLDALTNSGSIKSDFALDLSQAGEKQLRGSTGNGELYISLKTTSGSITVSRN